MSRAQYEGEMDRPSAFGGSARRARDRGEPGSPPDSSMNRRPPQPPPGFQPRGPDGHIGMAISRPQPVPQWPLAGPVPSPVGSDGSEKYRPPPNRPQQAPQRPPRPSIVPSILDASRVQEPTPVFQYSPQEEQGSRLSVPDTAFTASSRPSTISSVGSIPDFPVPQAVPMVPPTPPATTSRRTMGLGPPPSSRRGASSFYSTASFVSPIPEESPRSRSHTSYASSAAIPESYGTLSPGLSPDVAHFDDTIAEESVYSDDADERGLVRSASIGRKGKPSLVTTRSTDRNSTVRTGTAPIVLPLPSRPKPKPVQEETFQDGTGYLEGSSSSSSRPSGLGGPAETVTSAGGSPMLGAFAFDPSGSGEPASIRMASPSSRPAMFSAIRRPPRLDIDAVREAEARGSLTSLPDLIRRATRLASMIEKGKRPASGFNDLNFPPEMYGRDLEKDYSYGNEKYQSGLSDMLAAFPPPAQAKAAPPPRQSGSSWPLPMAMGRFSNRPVGPQTVERSVGDDNYNNYYNNDNNNDDNNNNRGGRSSAQPRRRCCGLPMWGFILLLVIVVAILAAAIIVPLEFFVIRKANNNQGAQPALDNCQAQLKCANGGTNTIVGGVCSCICSNGFTGTTCTVPGSDGCTTASLQGQGSALQNVTLGQAIPRLIQKAQAEFSVPLEAETILAKFNGANLSCNTENALVTFDGQSVRLGAAAPQLQQDGVEPTGFPFTVPLDPNVDVTLTLNNPALTATTLTDSKSTPTGSVVSQTTLTESLTAPTGFPLTPSVPDETTPTTTGTTKPSPSTSTTTGAPPSTTSAPGFKMSDQALDFGRVGVLFVLQEQKLEDAAAAQSALQKFFTAAGRGVTVEQASKVALGGNNSIDLVHLIINVNGKTVGAGSGR